MAWIAGIYLAMSVVTFIAYGVDKRRAVRGRWRIPERTLHLLELCGGWPGALAGQVMFHHKRRKLGYMLVLAMIIAAHVALWIACVHFGWMR